MDVEGAVRRRPARNQCRACAPGRAHPLDHDVGGCDPSFYVPAFRVKQDVLPGRYTQLWFTATQLEPGGPGPDQAGGSRGGLGRRHGGRGGRGGEQLVVPRARPDSYYGKPILKEPVWRSPEVPGYLFLGGLAGASSVLAGFAQAAQPQAGQGVEDRRGRGDRAIRRGPGGRPGRPERFLNMLRVVKPTSPMSVGSWLISAFGGASAAAAACEVTGRLPRPVRPPPRPRRRGPDDLHLHGRAALRHRGARLARGAPRDAVPVRRVRRQRGGRPGHDGRARRGRGQAIRFAVLGAATELTAKSLLLRRLGETAEPYSGRPGS